MRCWLVGAAVVLAAGVASGGASPERPAAQSARSAVERGKEALLGRSFSPPILIDPFYDSVWKVWGLKERPADFDRRLRERYGLHEAPYPNAGLPMGLRRATGLFGKGVGTDCLLCHAGSIAGQSVIGLGNSALDLQGLFDEFAQAQGLKQRIPIPFSHVRGTTEASASAGYLFQFRDAELNVRPPVKLHFCTTACEDAPAWWLLKKKKTMYAVGSHPARSVRPLMLFMLSPLNSGEYVKKQEATFKDIQAYLLSLEPPRYPVPNDEKKAAHGKKVFERTCARCHGTYGPGGSYPNRIVDLDIIGTDRTLAEGYDQTSVEVYNRSWFGREKGPDGRPLRAKANRGYQAPPLDGIWATAPYFHNGSVPTVYHVLNSRARPGLYTRSFRTGKEDYDPVRLGWRITVLEREPDPKLPAIERRKIYDTTQPGRGNGGHTFGDRLTEEERGAVLEYLKTL